MTIDEFDDAVLELCKEADMSILETAHRLKYIASTIELAFMKSIIDDEENE